MKIFFKFYIKVLTYFIFIELQSNQYVQKWADKSHKPEPGTIIFFDREQDGITDHVGIVEKCENGVVYTVEGNLGNMCHARQYSVGSSEIYGYGIPTY